MPSGSWVQFDLELVGGRQVRVSDIAANWWYPPEQWVAGELVHIDVDVPLRGLTSWAALIRTPNPA